jgi:hypothetical protein
MNTLTKNQTKTAWHKTYRIEALIIFTGFILMNLIFFAKAYRASNTVDPATAGQLGDFVGGYLGTLFTLVSVVLLFSTLKNQRIASQQQYFETKYFELIKMHRDNVSELEIQNIKGRKIFVTLIREFREILKIAITNANNTNQNLTQTQLIHVSYYCLFFGTGPNSTRMLKNSLTTFDKDFVDSLIFLLSDKALKLKVKKEKNFSHVPFEGHQSRLGHYYRHLFQTVKYVDQQTLDIKKYDYTKTIRAQLSTHEQALLLLNSLSPLGDKWFSNDYIKKYKLVKNIPTDFFDPLSELDTSTLFERGYFEWENP